MRVRLVRWDGVPSAWSSSTWVLMLAVANIGAAAGVALIVG